MFRTGAHTAVSSGPSVTARSRVGWLDAFRGLAILLVIAWHVFAVPALSGLAVPSGVDAFFGLISPVRMPLMFILSGMLLPLAVAKPFGAYVEGKARNLLWPYAVWFAITSLVALDLGTFTRPWAIIGGPYHLWFLAVLICCFVIAPVVRVVNPLLVALAMQGLLLFGDISTNVVIRFLFWGSLFFLGAWLWTRRDRIAGAGWWFPSLCVLVGVVSMAVVGASAEEPTTALHWTDLPSMIPWVLALLWLGPRLPRMAVLEWVGRNSVVFYVVHFPALLLVARAADAVDVPAAVVYPVGALLAYGLCWLMARCRRRLDWLFRFPGGRAGRGPGGH